MHKFYLAKEPFIRLHLVHEEHCCLLANEPFSHPHLVQKGIDAF